VLPRTPLQFASNPKVATPRTARVAIGALLALKHTLAALPELAAALGGCREGLLTAIRANLSHTALPELGRLIDGILTEDTTWSKSPAAMRQAECFAVRPNVDGNLDAVRAVSTVGGARRGTEAIAVVAGCPSERLVLLAALANAPSLFPRLQVYIECVGEIYALVERLREEWAMPGLKLHHTQTRGFHLQIPATTDVSGAGGYPSTALLRRTPQLAAATPCFLFSARGIATAAAAGGPRPGRAQQDLGRRLHGRARLAERARQGAAVSAAAVLVARSSWRLNCHERSRGSRGGGKGPLQRS
jgi:hypothetical protein